MLSGRRDFLENSALLSRKSKRDKDEDKKSGRRSREDDDEEIDFGKMDQEIAKTMDWLKQQFETVRAARASPSELMNLRMVNDSKGFVSIFE